MTAEGWQMIASMQPRIERFWACQLQIFSPNEKEQLVDLLVRFRDGLAITRDANGDGVLQDPNS